FEFAAFENPRLIPKLVLVAQRVRSWIEPLLYRNLSIVHDEFRRDEAVDVIRISTSNCLKVLDSKPTSFLHDHVRTLALTRVPSDSAALILSRCTGVLCLAMFQTAPPNLSMLPLVAAMALRYISADVDRLFGLPGIDFGHSIFASLSHLDLFEAPASESWPTDICRLPRLTHLSFNLDDTHRQNIGFTSFRTILTDCKSLEVLVLIFSEESDQEDFDQHQYFSLDSRSVTMVVNEFLEDWERGATGGVDYWVRAEIFIEKRRSGEIKGLPIVVENERIDTADPPYPVALIDEQHDC
ncbi:hypothetical protein K438DRAFT_1817870, partial [Mycena galopus ATCC 62051]